MNSNTNASTILGDKIDSLKTEISFLNSNTIEKGKLYSQLANLYSKQENFTDAKSNNLKALEIFKGLNAHANSTKVLLDLAMNYDRSNQFDIAIEYSYKALDELDLIKNELKKEDFDFRKGMIFMNMGVIYGQINNNSESLKLLTKANELLAKSNPFYRAVCQENLGNVYSELEQYNKAISFFNKALDFYINNNVEPKLISNTLNNIGNIYIATLEYNKALKQYKNALTYIDDEEIYLSEKTSILNSIGDAYIDLDSLELAKEYLDKSINLSKGEVGKRYIKDNYENRVKLFQKQKNYKKAFENLAILKNIEDSLFQPKLLEKIASLKSEYDLKIEQRENLLKIELLEQEKEINLYKNYALIFLIIVILILAFLFYNRQKQRTIINKIELKNTQLEKHQLTSKLKFKNNQLTNYAIYIVKKNEFLESIKNEIDELKIEGDSKLNSLSKIVNQHINSTQERKDFEIRIKNENQDFYYKLDSKYPDLSEKNKNLCSLLLLDLSSKEIASLLNISVESVEKSRYRLRKKLNIPKEISISAFLNNL